MNKITITEIGDRELEKLVHDTFGGDYSFAATEECGNDSQHLFTGISSEVDEADYSAGDIRRFESTGNSGPLTNYQILGILCKRGVLTPGDYLVSVCW